MGTPNFPTLAPIPFGKGVEGTPNFPALAPIPLGKGVEGTPNFPALARTNSVWEERRGNPEFPRYFGILRTKLPAPVGGPGDP